VKKEQENVPKRAKNTLSSVLEPTDKESNMEHNEEEMMRLARSAVNRLQIDKLKNNGHDYEEAIQEACLYYLQGKIVLTELTKWHRGRNKVKAALGLEQDTLGNPDNHNKRIDARIDEVKNI